MLSGSETLIRPTPGEIGNRLRQLGVTEIEPIYSGTYRAVFRCTNPELLTEYLVMLQFADIQHTEVIQCIIQLVENPEPI